MGFAGLRRMMCGFVGCFCFKEERERDGGGGRKREKERKRHRGRITKEYLNEVVKKIKSLMLCVL